MKKFLFALCAFVGAVATTQAQQTQYIDRNFKLDLPFNRIQMPGADAAEAKGTTHVEVIDFGTKGRTIILHFDCPELESMFKQAGLDFRTKNYFSWSGKNVHLGKTLYKGEEVYSISRGNVSQFKLGAVFSKSVLVMKNDQGAGTLNYDIHKGMSRAEVERFLTGKGMKWAQSGKEGNLRIWTLKWLQVQDVYNIFGNVAYAELNNDKKYVDFYFDANDKLVKWFVYM